MKEEIAKGNFVLINGANAFIRKVRRLPTMFHVKGTSIYRPMVRIYWKQGKRRGHTDSIIEDGIKVVIG